MCYCYNCAKWFEISFMEWLFTSFFHRFNFHTWKDSRKIKCPFCGNKSYMEWTHRNDFLINFNK
jgi:hypothetical protein